MRASGQLYSSSQLWYPATQPNDHSPRICSSTMLLKSELPRVVRALGGALHKVIPHSDPHFIVSFYVQTAIWTQM